MCVAVSVSIIDLLKAFFLFWPANTMPMWLLISLLQLFIPLNLLLKSFCIDGVQHYKIHWIAACIIFVGCIINMFTLGYQNHMTGDEKKQNVVFSILLILSAVLDVISHTIKEALVRSQPLN